jgi:hypothetical protein
MKFLTKKIGKFYPIEDRTKWAHEISGMTIRQWLFIIPRLIILLPLVFLSRFLDWVQPKVEDLVWYISDKFE